MSAARYDILLLDDGELSEIRGAARALSATVHTDMDGPGTPVEWPLVVASTRYLEKLESIAVNLSAKRVVVLDRLSQTLRARMRRARVDFFLCRPVHPEALRLLLLHCLYQGPERRQRRVAVGASVRFRSGFRRGAGVLADLSETGCRILATNPLARDQKLLVFLPRADRPGRTFFVRAEVVRVAGGAQPTQQMALRFYSVGGAARRRIDELIARYGDGPAVFDGDTQAALAEPEPVVGSAPNPGPSRAAFGAQVDPPAGFVRFGGESLETDVAVDADTPSLELDPEEPRTREKGAAEGSDAHPGTAEPRAEETIEVGRGLSLQAAEERRREPRRAFLRQVVALDRSATRILIGRDLSVGGMRVDSNTALVRNKTFRLSIHVGEGELPLVVRARVARDDGDEGVVLCFEQLGFAVQEHLRKSLRDLPILAPGEDGLPEGVLVTEILDESDRVASAS